jgi:hypothetical protein
MLRLLTRVALVIWIVLGIADLVSLAPTAVEGPPVHGSEAQQGRNGTGKSKPSIIGRAFVDLGDLVHAYKDEITAGSTFIIAVFTTILGLFTVSLARSTRQAANSAAESSEAAVAAERGFIVEVLKTFNLDPAFWAARYPNSPTMTSAGSDLKTTISLKNYGKTPATIRDVRVDILLSRDALTAVGEIGEMDYTLDEATISQNDETSFIEKVRSDAIDWDTSIAISKRIINIYFVGRIVFFDVF